MYRHLSNLSPCPLLLLSRKQKLGGGNLDLVSCPRIHQIQSFYWGMTSLPPEIQLLPQIMVVLRCKEQSNLTSCNKTGKKATLGEKVWKTFWKTFCKTNLKKTFHKTHQQNKNVEPSLSPEHGTALSKKQSNKSKTNDATMAVSRREREQSLQDGAPVQACNTVWSTFTFTVGFVFGSFEEANRTALFASD